MIRRILLVAGALVLVAHAASGAIEDTVERVLTLDFLAQRENVIVVAPHGLGKTMIAKNLVHEASLAGHSARFLTAADLILDLTRQETARAAAPSAELSATIAPRDRRDRLHPHRPAGRQSLFPARVAPL